MQGSKSLSGGSLWGGLGPGRLVGRKGALWVGGGRTLTPHKGGHAAGGRAGRRAQGCGWAKRQKEGDEHTIGAGLGETSGGEGAEGRKEPRGGEMDA